MSGVTLTFLDKTYYANKDTTLSFKNGTLWTLLTYNIRSASDLLNNTAFLVSHIGIHTTHIIFNVLAFDFARVKEGFDALNKSSRIYSYQLVGKLIGMVPIIGQIFCITLIKRSKDNSEEKQTAWKTSNEFNRTTPEINTSKRAVYETFMIPAKLAQYSLFILQSFNSATSALILANPSRLKIKDYDCYLPLAAALQIILHPLGITLKAIKGIFSPINHLLGKAK